MESPLYVVVNNIISVSIHEITVKNNKDIENIELHFDEKIQKYFISKKEAGVSYK
jgi:hypothetical protein